VLHRNLTFYLQCDRLIVLVDTNTSLPCRHDLPPGV